MEYKTTRSIKTDKCDDIEIIKKMIDEVVDEVIKQEMESFWDLISSYKFKCVCDYCHQEFVSDLPTRFCDKCNITESAKLPKLFTYRSIEQNEHE